MTEPENDAQAQLDALRKETRLLREVVVGALNGHMGWRSKAERLLGYSKREPHEPK
jgi:hypothetical protein